MKYRWTLLDTVIAAAIIATLSFAAWRIVSSLNYRWNWAGLWGYILRTDPISGKLSAGLLLQGLGTTIRLSIWAMLIAIPLGLIVALLRLSRRLFNRWIGRTFLELVRNTPPIVIIFIGYYFFSERLLPVIDPAVIATIFPTSMIAWIEFLFGPLRHLSPFLSATISIAIIEAVSIAEIIRAGIAGIDRGQSEAADALGLSRMQRLQHVILPQAVRNILPPLSGQFISTIKDSAIVSVISIRELCFQGTEIISATYLNFETWITITVMYAVLTFGLSYVISRMEHRVRKHTASTLFRTQS